MTALTKPTEPTEPAGSASEEEWRLLVDPPACGAWNMAVDEVLLEWAAEQRRCCWRLYRWEEPTLSLGYFQDYGDCRGHAPSRNCPVVRRLTGGGAILHDAELTYSLVVPAEHPLATRRNLLYETVHHSLIETLAGLGAASTLYGQSSHGEGGAGNDEPFLCFQRRTPGDVLIEQVKIAGSAQRRRRGAVLQHGSVVLRRSVAAPEIMGVEDVSGERIAADDLAHDLPDAWLAVVARHLAITWRREPLSPAQRDRAAALVESRYASARWTEQRQR